MKRCNEPAPMGLKP